LIEERLKEINLYGVRLFEKKAIDTLANGVSKYGGDFRTALNLLG
jgi:hypothetical protein